MSNDYNPFNTPEFRAELSKMFDEKLGPLVALKQELNDISARVGEHDQAINRSRGALWVLGGLWALLMSMLSGHLFFGRQH